MSMHAVYMEKLCMTDTEMIDWIIINNAQIWFEPGLGRGWTIQAQIGPSGFVQLTRSDLRRAIEAAAKGEK
jgi:hypothetical protein